MAQPAIKTSFASGEWAPKLRGRVDIQKYHAGAALLRNFFVDYSGGGASTRQGTQFINQCKANGSRVIPFQPGSALSYVLEFGQNYIRFFSNGSPIVETATVISGATQANPGVITDVAHGYSTGDWVFLKSIVGMTQLNGNYYIVVKLSANTYSLTDLNGVAVNTTGFGAYVSGGTAQRVYTITSPYVTGDLFPNPATGNPGLKFVQDVTSLIITHPSYQPQILTITTSTSWAITTITFGPTIPTPGSVVVGTNLAAGLFAYSYLVTAVDAAGQESGPSTPASLAAIYAYLGSSNGTNTIQWAAVTGAVSYNVYKALPVYNSTFPTGTQYGFIGNVTGTQFLDAFPGIVADFAQTPPVVQNPFLGASISRLQLTSNNAYTSVPTVTIPAPPSGLTATAHASLTVNAANVAIGGNVGPTDPTGQQMNLPNGIVVGVASAHGIGPGAFAIDTVSLVNGGSLTSGIAPASENPTSITGGLSINSPPTINLGWTVGGLVLDSGGTGYIADQVVTFNPAGATATAFIGTASAGNPGVPGFIQQRLALAGQTRAVQSFNFSQPTNFFNFNVSNPSQADDAISGTIISEELNDIRSLTPVPTGIMALTGRGSWLINGGGGISTQTPITPSNATAQPQAFNGANDLRPLKINFDILYGTNKGNYVRDLSYNLYAQIFTGSDISVLSNHLFFGFSIADWTWAEEPFKTMWAVRNDGQMLSLGYVKEQELIGWAHHDTNGQFKSVCSVIETVGGGNIVDAVYVIVQRLINANLVSYIERMADRYFAYGYEDSWSVDAALQTTPAVSPVTTLTVAGDASTVGNVVILTDTAGVPFTAPMAASNWIVRANGGIYRITAFTSTSQVTASVVQSPAVINLYTNTPFPAIGGYTIWQPITTVSGLTHLVGQSVVGVADGAAIGPFVVSASGSVALGVTATKVTLGLSFLPQMQTLPLDLGEPTVQGKRKKITGLTLRVADTLGLSAGKTFGTLVAMKDFTRGNVPTTSTGISVVNGLVNGDGRTIIDQQWDTAGSYCIQQNLPYPATILAAMPEVAVGDGK